MPERKGKLGQTLSMVLMLVVMAGIAVGLGVLMGRYVFDVLTTGPTADESSPPEQAGPVDETIQDVAPSSAQGPATGPLVASPTSQQPGAAAPAPAGDTGTTAPSGEGSALHRVQVGEFTVRTGAENLARELANAGYPGFVISGPPYRVQVGAFTGKANADRLASELEQKGYSVLVLR